MLNVYYFTTSGWGGTGDLTAPVQENTLWGQAVVRRGLTFDHCYNACQPTEDDPVVITPDPDAAAFRDANGFRLHTVTVPLGANFTATKRITLAGGAYRLRFDGGGAFKFLCSSVNRQEEFYDCEFANTAFTSNYYATWNFYRCAFVNISSFWTDPMSGEAYDCIAYGSSAPISAGNVYWYRSTVDHKRRVGADSISTASMTDEDLAANFVDAANGDFRLLSSSPYATGNALTSADGDVYDLAGNKRKVGGAKGAFEVLDDVTAVFNKESLNNLYYYKIVNEQDAPQIKSYFCGWRQASGGASMTYLEIDIEEPLNRVAMTIGSHKTYHTRSSVSYSGAGNRYGAVLLQYVDDNGDPINDAASRVLVSATQIDASYKPIAQLNKKNNWLQPTDATSLPNNMDNNSVCYIDANAAFADTASTVGKIYVPGWRHVKLGDVTTSDSLELGLGATVESSGKLTLKNETWNSAELMRRVQLRAPAILTLKDCQTSD